MATPNTTTDGLMDSASIFYLKGNAHSTLFRADFALTSIPLFGRRAASTSTRPLSKSKWATISSCPYCSETPSAISYHIHHRIPRRPRTARRPRRAARYSPRPRLTIPSHSNIALQHAGPGRRGATQPCGGRSSAGHPGDGAPRQPHGRQGPQDAARSVRCRSPGGCARRCSARGRPRNVWYCVARMTVLSRVSVTDARQPAPAPELW